jgi:hypothetical protein
VLALCAGVAGWQAVVIGGLVITAWGTTQPVATLSAVAAAASFAFAVHFLTAAACGRPMSDRDRDLLAWLVGIAGFTAAAVALASRHVNDLPMLLWCAGFVIAHGLPALLLRAHERRTPDTPREPHYASGFLTVLFVGVLVAGWTAGLSGLAYAIANPWHFDTNNDYTVTLHEHVSGGLMFASEVQWLGFILGLLGSVMVVIHLLMPTRLNRSIPFVFVPPLVVGPLLAFFDPLLAIVAVAFVVAALAVVAMYRFPLPGPGHCQSCGYDLTGSTSPRCPECGVEAAITPAETASGAHAEPRA